MKNILYATDYSKNSITALKYAYELSTKINAQLKVIHVFHYPSTLVEMTTNTDDDFGVNYFKRHTAKLDQFCYDYLGTDLKNVSVEAVENKSILEGIISKAKELSPRLVIVGTKGQSSIKDLIMGNTTKNLIEKGLFPVMSIPSIEQLPELKTIVYATAFEEEDLHAICKLTEIALPLNATIKIVHVSSKKDYPGDIQMEWFKEMLSEKLDYKNLEFKVITSDDVFNSLRKYANDVNADLLAMLERKKGGFLKNLLNKDTVHKMNDYGKYPLISFNTSNCIKLSFS
ncbi:universal stress protein [Aureibaculum marinum]|uniref:Universal stress protein n=1 Tax=Aureibaculum marinum TaxID=2487930 RepID=A0A3N4NVK6_9FLAO|nr:universal stress protein [Aureibaculum marinum]RPD98727.1 universal stress protein [Aureibaculum marinum]